jgi:peroxiredoxin family protein
VAESKRLLLLCHDGGWDRLYQAASAAATAASSGWRVDLVFYFDALEKLLDGRLDEFTLSSGDVSKARRLEETADELGTRSPSQLLRVARAGGNARVLACSASLGLLGRDPAEVDPGIVDEVVGWPTTIALIGAADSTLYL